jgi:hypothetical protein
MSEHNDNPHDEQISRLYRLGSSGEPPAHLDRKILDQAQRTTSRWRRIKPWHSLATAAVLVLSFSLLLQVMEQQPLDRSIMHEEEVLLDRDIAPVSQEMDDGAGVFKEEGEVVAPPLPKAAPSEKLEAGTILKSRDGAPVPSKAKRKEAAVEELRIQVAAPPAVFSAPASSTEGFVGGAMQADEAAAEPVVKLERKLDSEGCGIALPIEGSPVESWQQLYRELLEQEKREQAECLREIYEQRFGQQLELSQTPESSVE